MINLRRGFAKRRDCGLRVADWRLLCMKNFQARHARLGHWQNTARVSGTDFSLSALNSGYGQTKVCPTYARGILPNSRGFWGEIAKINPQSQSPNPHPNNPQSPGVFRRRFESSSRESK